MNMNINTKTKAIKDDVFKIIENTVNKAADFVKPTFGPASNNVIIDKLIHKAILDDGVQILRDLEFEDPAENAVLRRIKETAIKTNDRVGDGTTGAMIMLQAIINEVSKKDNFNGRNIRIEIKRAAEEAKKQLLESKINIETKEDLKKVALVSYDNEEVAEMIAETYDKHGKDLTMTVDDSPTMDTFVEESAGITIDKGYVSPYMITNFERMEAEIKDPVILVTDYNITDINDILPVMEKMASEGKRELVLLAENVAENALATIVLNKLQQKFNIVAVNIPLAGSSKKEFLEDIALMTGAEVFSKANGKFLPKNMSEVDLSRLGRSSKFICRKSESIIVKPEGNKTQIETFVNELKKASENEKEERVRKEIENRIAVLTNKIAVIKAGALTDSEQKTLKYKIEDAVNAVKCAFNGGVVAGSGLALSKLTTSSEILNKALQYPHKQLFENMGIEVPELKEGEAFNITTGETGNFMDVGVIDPALAHIAAIDSAVSIASLLVTSTGIIVEHEEQNN